MFLFGAASLRAAPIQGVTVTVYDNWTPNNLYNNAPPVPPSTPVAGQMTAERVSWNFNRQPVFGLWDDFVVRFDGYLTAPVTGAIRFYVPGDDGIKLILNDQMIINDWYDKGGGGTPSQAVEMTEGESVPFTVWFYENGGGAWLTMYWDIGRGWEEIGPEVFSTIGSWATTTTTTTTVPPSTVTSTTSSPTSSSTTTTQPDPPTTTSTSTPPTLTSLMVPSTTTTVTPSSSTASSSSSSVPIPTVRTTTTSTTFVTPTTTSSTIPAEAPVTVPEASSTLPSTQTPEIQNQTTENGATFVRKVKIGPINITLKATKKQRRTVMAAAIVQITTVATLSTTGVATSGTNTRRRR